MRLFVWFVGLLQVQATKYVNVTYDSDIIDKAGFKILIHREKLFLVGINSFWPRIPQYIENYQPKESLESIPGRNFGLLGNN